MNQTRFMIRAITFASLLLFADLAWSQDVPAPTDAPLAEAAAKPDDSATTAPGDQLSVDQARLADRFKRLEEVIGRLAELSASTDPRRAKLLRDAIAQSREQDINVRFESVVKLLEDERLSAAATNQSELQKELDGLLTLLLKADRDNELTSQRERVKKYLKEVSRLIRLQKGIRARTEGGDELRELGDDQQRVASETGKLGGDIAQTEGDKKEVSDDAKNDEAKEDEAKEDDEKKGDDQPDEPQDKPDESGDDSKSGDASKPSESDKPPGEPNPGESKPGEAKPAESKPGESKPSQPQDGKPSESEPSESKPSDGKPSDSKPQDQPGSPSEGEPSEDQNQQPEQPQDPAERAAERLRDAQKKMEEAREKLKDAERKGAADEQRQALKDLEQAKAELERVLRQLREEELERTLTQLAARFRKMLELQNQVYEGTVRLDKVAEADRDQDDEIESARLSRLESQIVNEADKALLLLHEEGSSVAFPEAIEQMRGDMRQITERLAAVKVDKITQGLEEDVIAALEEVIATLEKAIKDLEKKKTPPGQQPAAGEQAEPPLVDKIAELKMIRSLQIRIYKRTQRYGEMIEGEQAETADLLEALKDLAERQQRVYQATADLEQGRND